MSLEYAILALLTTGPRHGYAIGKELSRLQGGIWPVNPGQVYATLDRLARDGAIASAPPPRATRARTASSAASGAGTRAARLRPFALLPAGRRALRRWLDRPVGGAPPHDALAADLALHAWAGDAAGVARLVARTTSPLCRAARAARRAAARDDGATLLLRAAQQHLDAELAWLALVEQVVPGLSPSPAPPLMD